MTAPAADNCASINQPIAFNEKRRPIRQKKQPNLRAGSKSGVPGMGSVQGDLTPKNWT
jgi:hypothetical protein